jgi:hypothetical protein
VVPFSLAVLAVPGPAAGSAADVFGLGSAAVGAGDAAVAEATDFAACHYNPAGLARASRPSLSVGYALADSRLRADGRTLEIDHPGGLLLGFSLPVALPLDWLPQVALGLALYAPPDVVVAVRGRPADEPSFPYYADRLQRWLVLPALALRFPGGLTAGAAVDFFAGIRGPVAAAEGPTGAIEGRTQEEMFGTATPLVGLRWDPSAWLSVGLVYRAEFAAPVSTVSSVDAGGASLRLDASAVALYRPDTVVLGAALRGDSWRAEADLSWERWSAFAGPYFSVEASLLGIDVSPAAPRPHFRDAFGLRVGGEWRWRALPLEVALRGGYGFEPGLLPDGSAGTALLDGDKHVVSAGLGLVLRLPDAPAITFDAHVAAHIVPSASAVVVGREADAAPRSVSADGAVLSAGLVLGAEL